MSRPLALGRPGSTIVPDGWEQQLGTVADRILTCAVELREIAGTGTWDPGTETTLRDTAVLWTGYARIQALNVAAGGGQLAAEQTLSVGTYRVSLPRTVTVVRVGHQVAVLSTSDVSLEGRVLTVVDIRRGSLVWQRDLVCTDDETRPTP